MQKAVQSEIKVTPELAAEHGLTREEYARVLKILGREPSITELGVFSVMWSEHCSYKSTPRTFEAAADDRRCSDAGARGKCGRGGYRRWVVRDLQNRIAQSSELRGTVPGCGHGRGRDSARHFHDGRASDRGAGFAAIWACERRTGRLAPLRLRKRARIGAFWMASCAASGFMGIVSVFPRWGATWLSRHAIRATRS